MNDKKYNSAVSLGGMEESCTPLALLTCMKATEKLSSNVIPMLQIYFLFSLLAFNENSFFLFLNEKQ